MKTAVVISDTHGNMTDLKKLYPIFEENDYILFLGDGLKDVENFPAHIKSKVVAVSGNCDYSTAPTERVLEIEGVKVFMTHGHLYGVKGSLLRLLLKGKEEGAAVCFYGHNHRANIEKAEGVYLVNPGTLTRYAIEKTFAYCVFSDGKFTPTINKNFFDK